MNKKGDLPKVPPVDKVIDKIKRQGDNDVWSPASPARESIKSDNFVANSFAPPTRPGQGGKKGDGGSGR